MPFLAFCSSKTLLKIFSEKNLSRTLGPFMEWAHGSHTSSLRKILLEANNLIEMPGLLRLRRILLQNWTWTSIFPFLHFRRNYTWHSRHLRNWDRDIQIPRRSLYIYIRIWAWSDPPRCWIKISGFPLFMRATYEPKVTPLAYFSSYYNYKISQCKHAVRYAFRIFS